MSQLLDDLTFMRDVVTSPISDTAKALAYFKNTEAGRQRMHAVIDAINKVIASKMKDGLFVDFGAYILDPEMLEQLYDAAIVHEREASRS